MLQRSLVQSVLAVVHFLVLSVPDAVPTDVKEI